MTQKENHIKDIFDKILVTNHWHEGVDEFEKDTEIIKGKITEIIKELNIKSVLDAGCYTRPWIKEVDLAGASYKAIDVSPLVVKDCNANFPDIDCKVANVIKDKLPKVDLIICRDVLVHLSNENILKAIPNLLKSCKYILMTTFDNTENVDIENGNWRPLDLTKEPFNMPKPEMIIFERKWQDKNKYCNLWKI